MQSTITAGSADRKLFMIRKYSLELHGMLTPPHHSTQNKNKANH
jgi:hypothetical protein